MKQRKVWAAFVCLACVGFVTVLTVLVLKRTNTATNASLTPPSSESVSADEKYLLFGGTICLSMDTNHRLGWSGDLMPVATRDAVDVSTFIRSANGQDYYTRNELQTTGRVFLVPRFTAVKIVSEDAKNETVRIQISDGIHKGDEGFVYRMMLQQRTPNWVFMDIQWDKDATKIKL